MLAIYGNVHYGGLTLDGLLQDLSALWLPPNYFVQNTPVPTPATVIDIAQNGAVLSQAVAVTSNTLVPRIVSPRNMV
jgi:hypothetical protein